MFISVPGRKQTTQRREAETDFSPSSFSSSSSDLPFVSRTTTRTRTKKARSLRARAAVAAPSARSRFPLEQLVEAVLHGSVAGRDAARGVEDLARKVLDLDVSGTRVVILGGGTGLSTVVGGNSQMADWPDHPFGGLKSVFPRLDVIVCTTDDGGSTGLLVQQLPMIGIGDLRKSCLSLISAERLQKAYGLSAVEIGDLVRVLQRIFNHRFGGAPEDTRVLRDPLRAAPPSWRAFCPPRLAAGLRELGGYVSKRGRGPTIDPAGHCLGNLLLTAAIFRAARGNTRRAPDWAAMRRGLDAVGALIGVTPGRLHAATSTPGQLKFCYANGVEVYGQSKSASARRGFPVERVQAEFVGPTRVSPAILRAIREADLIVFAPGSLYTSMIPILQVRPIAESIRGNPRALKILAANFWIQEGETDISPGNEGRGFLVSELIEAYDRNVPGGVRGLFQVVFTANLEHIPGNILRNYALEGKRPIHLDRARVEAMGYQPVEATLFSPERLKSSQVIHHDAEKFALSVRALVGARQFTKGLPARWQNAGATGWRREQPARVAGRSRLLCDYLAAIKRALARKHFRPATLEQVLVDIAWDNRDIAPAHLDFFDGVRVIRAASWHRSTEWDNVLGYFDPVDRCLKIHEHLMTGPLRLREDLLIALGESLLGRYIESRRWTGGPADGLRDARCYEIRLRPVRARDCFLNDGQLRTYLRLARMVQDRRDARVFRITINNNEGFLPPGLLFGLLYVWYLNDACGGIMEYEMSLLQWLPHSLIPHQAKERVRKQALVAFFRSEVFGHRQSAQEPGREP
jgi:uncharacterized cofD-like protein